MKKFAIVHPVKTIQNPQHSHYTYPEAFITGKLSYKVVTYNRNLDDFLEEQMWLLDGTEQEIKTFLGASNVTAIEDWDSVKALSDAWNPPRTFITDEKAVVEEIAKLKGPSPTLDASDPTPGIVTKTFKLEDSESKESVEGV